jgi:hypothetical protein
MHHDICGRLIDGDQHAVDLAGRHAERPRPFSDERTDGRQRIGVGNNATRGIAIQNRVL